MTVCERIMPFYIFSYATALVLRETLEGIRGGEGAESWTEVIAHSHFYPDLHGMLYTLTHTPLLTGILPKETVLPSRTRV
jgi:hypothetical protein